MLAAGPNPVSPASISSTPAGSSARSRSSVAAGEPLSTTAMRGTRLWARKRSTVRSTASGLSRWTITRSTRGSPATGESCGAGPAAAKSAIGLVGSREVAARVVRP